MEINIYCDESCHLENDNSDSMFIGAISCPKDSVKYISSEIRKIKLQHGFKRYEKNKRGFEVKWTKIGKSKLEFYKSLIDLFFKEENLQFRSIIIPNKKLLDHETFNRNHNDFYYVAYYLMLNKMISFGLNSYKIYIDIKDTCGIEKTKELSSFLRKKIRADNKKIEDIQQIRSDESEILQLTDLILGAISYENRGISSSANKIEIINYIKCKLGDKNFSFTKSTPLSSKKFNIFCWSSTEIVK